MSTHFIDLAGQFGANLGQGLNNYQEGRAQKQKDKAAAALAAWAAGDTEGAYNMAREADEVDGLFGKLSTRVGPKLAGTQVTEQVPAPAIGKLMPPEAIGSSVGAPAPKFGLNPEVPGADILRQPLNPAPQGKLLPVTYQDGSRPDFANAGNVEAIRKYVGAPVPKLTQYDPYKDVVEEGTGRVVRKAAENPYKMTAEDAAALRREGYTAAEERARLMGGYGIERTRMTTTASTANNAANNATRVTTTGMNNTTSTANAAMAAAAAADRAAAAAADKKNAAAAAAMAKKVAASGILAEDIAKKFPWAGVQGVDPTTGDIIINAPVGALSPRNERLLRDYMPGTAVLGKGRIMVTGTPDLANLRAKVKPPKAAPAPKPPKPFDAEKARKNVMASMGLRPSQRIRPDQQARYDALMKQERDAHNRASNGGKSALQMLLEMPD